MLNSILMSIFRISSPKIPILGIFGPKMKNAPFGIKFGLIQLCWIKFWFRIWIRLPLKGVCWYSELRRGLFQTLHPPQLSPKIPIYPENYVRPKCESKVFRSDLKRKILIRDDNWWYWSLMNMDEHPDLLDYSQEFNNSSPQLSNLRNPLRNF